jgi:N-acetylmuramoyl-L-alanine amidase
MSDTIDDKRRSIIKLGGCLLLTLFLDKVVRADEITDLISNDAQNQIVALRLWPSSVYTRLTVEADESVASTNFRLTNPDRLVIDIKNARLNAVIKGLANKVTPDDPLIQGIKVGQFDKDTVRIVIGLKQEVKVQTQEIDPISIGKVSYKYRYVIDMYPSPGTTTDMNDDMLALLLLQDDIKNNPVNANIARNKAYPELKPLASNPSKKIFRSGKILVMLDPGHGGEDPGAIGSTGTKEKHVVLDIAKHLCDLINQTDYMSAQLTRSQDIFIPLGTRVAMARSAHADVFMSIHADAFTTPKARGSSVFILSERGATSSFAKWLAKTQNESDKLGGMSFAVKDKTVNGVLLDMVQSWSLKKSTSFANVLLNNLASANKLHNGHIEKAAFAVLKAPDIPSALVETAFLSNPVEEELLKSQDFRYKIANALFNGIGSFAKSMLTPGLG